MQRIVMVLLCVLLMACTSEPQRLHLPALQLAPAAFGGNVSLAQQLTLSKVSTAEPMPTRRIDAQLEIDEGQVRLAGLALGQRVLTLRWNGEKLDSERHPLLPEEVDATRVLRDIQLVYWPAEAIQVALPQGWHLRDERQQRVLSFDGVAQVSIRYAGEPRWIGQATIDNRLEQYRLEIDSAPIEE